MKHLLPRGATKQQKKASDLGLSPGEYPLSVQINGMIVYRGSSVFDGRQLSAVIYATPCLAYIVVITNE